MANNEDIESILKEGANHFSQKNYSRSLELYSAVLASDPSNVRALSNRSACYSLLHQYQDALRDAEAVLAIDPQYLKAYGRKGAALQGLKHFEDALTTYREGLVRDPNNTGYMEAIKELDVLVKSGQGIPSKASLDRYYYKQSLEKGKESMLKGEYFEAIRFYTDAIELYKGGDKVELAVLLCNRGRGYFRLQKFEEALRDAKEAVETTSGNYGRAHLLGAESLAKLLRLDDAHRAVEEVLRLDPSSESGKELLAALDLQLAAKNKSSEAKAVEFRQKAVEIEASRGVEGQSLRRDGKLHASSYKNCTYCNEFGHDRADCPMLRRKRPRN